MPGSPKSRDRAARTAPPPWRSGSDNPLIDRRNPRSLATDWTV